ncbi:putative reverse transcriptase domain-containing protein, partial [Tanacetum coccineum]
LRLLYLNRNKFSGVIPTNLSRCSNLEDLWLHRNELTRSILMLLIQFILSCFFHYISWYQSHLIKMPPRRSEGEESKYPFFEGDASSSGKWKDYCMAGDDYEGPPIFDDDQFDDDYEGPPVFDDYPYEEEIVSGDVGKGFKKNQCQFMIPILKMSLRKKKDLLGKENWVGKKTTSKTSSLWLMIFVLQ